MGATSNDSSSSSMSPLSSPSYVDLYGKRRQIAKVQVLEREISLLQEEIKSLAALELASRCCKELDEFVEATPDPLIALYQTRGRSRSFWKILRRKFGSMLRCCCCAKGCCCWSNPNPCSCPEISCHCTCNPCSCPKCSLCCCCCCNPCSCF